MVAVFVTYYLPRSNRYMWGGDHQAEVELQIGKFSVWSHITKWAVDELRLKTGEHVYAQIKGISVTQDDWSSVSADAN